MLEFHASRYVAKANLLEVAQVHIDDQRNAVRGKPTVEKDIHAPAASKVLLGLSLDYLLDREMAPVPLFLHSCSTSTRHYRVPVTLKPTL